MTPEANDPDKLYRLLPALYRELDIEQGEQLRALLRIIQGQADLIEGDIRRLWDNFFVETCDPWVISYLADLVGTTPLFDAGRIQQPDTARDLAPDLTGPSLIPEVAARGRADVAKTIYYRRRKGTLAMLEELARDVTGWAAHAVEFFSLLGWTQYVRGQLRMQSTRTPDIRRVEAIDRLDGPFDTSSHTVDVRSVDQHTGWHNIKNIGFFVWRLRSYDAEHVQARPAAGADGFGYHVSPLGNPAPLFTRWRREGDEAGLATEFHVPAPIRPAAFYEDLRQYLELPVEGRPGFTEFYGLFDLIPEGEPNPENLPQAPGSSLMIFRDGMPVPPDRIRCMDLSAWRRPADPDDPRAEFVAVDVRLGRLAFSGNWQPTENVNVFYHYGFPADLGGGSYRRAPWLARRELASLVIPVDQSGSTPASVTSLSAALALWQAAGRPATIVTILDSRTYAESIAIEPAGGRWLVIEAGDGVRPHLLLDRPLTITGDHPDASITLSGLLVEGAISIEGSLGRLRLLHSTLVPGLALRETDGGPHTTDPSVEVAGGTENEPLNTRLRVEIAFSITGPLRIPDHAEGLWVLDSIVDGVGTAAIAGPGRTSGPKSWLERVSVLGAALVKQLSMASEVVFTGPAIADQCQAGCVRFSYLPAGSRTPQRFRCQPDLEVTTQIEAAEAAAQIARVLPAATDRNRIRDAVRSWLAPSFMSSRYGQPAYAQLHLRCPSQIREGAEDGSEMGAFCHLKQPQREANLRLRLDEYLPLGLEPGIIYVT